MADPVKQLGNLKRQRSSAFTQVEEKVTNPQKRKTPTPSVPSSQKAPKVRREDFEGEPYKKTTIEMPVSMLRAWTMYCASRDIRKVDHIIDLLGTELKKAGLIK